jgi:hypothetical protein
MQPTAPLFRQIAGQHQNPFSDYLRPVQPRPIDTTPPVGQTATGWETAPVATAELALGALQGVRQNRIANFLETEKNNENALNQFQTYVQGRLQDPDLTEEGRQAILQHANDVMHRHMQYELRDTPKDGIGGFFKNLLINASGGPIKTREPINWNEATGTITTVAAGHSQKENFNKAVQAAQAEIDQIRNTSGMVMPSQLSAVVAKWMPQVMTGAPTYAQAFPQVISGMAPADPYQEEFMRARLDALRRLRGQVASPQAPPQQHPNGEVSVSSMAQPYLGMVMPTAAEAAPADVRPAESGTAPIPTMDLRNPINRAILKDFGYKIGEPTTIYDLADLTQAVPNSLWDPLQNAWIDASTGKRLPEQQQRYVPHDQIKLPQVSQEVMFSGATEEGGPTRLGLTNRSKANVRWVTDDGKPIYSPTVMEETIGPSGARVYTPRSRAVVQWCLRHKRTPGPRRTGSQTARRTTCTAGPSRSIRRMSKGNSGRSQRPLNPMRSRVRPPSWPGDLRRVARLSVCFGICLAGSRKALPRPHRFRHVRRRPKLRHPVAAAD